MKDALQLLRRVHFELLDVLNSINNDKIHHDGDDFHELLLDVEAALAQDETSSSRAAQEPVAWQVEMFIAGEWVPLGNPQRSKTKAEALASNPSLSKEHQRIFPVYTAPQPTQEPVAWMDIDEKGSASGLRYWSEPDNRHEVALYILKEKNT